MKGLEEFRKKKEFLIGVDSDGCAMDTMDCKHKRCFGPCCIKEWELEKWKEPILQYWNEVNLYTMTRGINRFLGLSKVLLHIDEIYTRIPEIKEFGSWVEQSKELSNASLYKMYRQTNRRIYKKALSWSEKVNEEIAKLPEECKKPFDGAVEGIRNAHSTSDIAIVSSANKEAVTKEWETFGLMEWVDVCLTQDKGSKSYCIGLIKKQGYAKDHILIIGDAPGDKEAADRNEVLFYPIQVKKEAQSWKRFVEEALPKFLEGSYRGEYEKQVIREFYENLS